MLHADTEVELVREDGESMKSWLSRVFGMIENRNPVGLGRSLSLPTDLTEKMVLFGSCIPDFLKSNTESIAKWLIFLFWMARQAFAE